MHDNFIFEAEDDIRDLVRARGLGEVCSGHIVVGSGDSIVVGRGDSSVVRRGCSLYTSGVADD